LNGTELSQGLGGRKHVLSAGSSADEYVVKVQAEHFDSTKKPFMESALVENLIIDGKGYNIPGILLDNVCNCQIRNVTIRNCDVGIHIRSSDGLWSETNCLKHIRMENVTKGIVFTTTGPYIDPQNPGNQEIQKRRPGDSAGFTTIDDVGIKLADNRSGTVGIQVGGTQMSGDVNNKLILPYSSRIRANVWMSASDGVGLKVINGRLSYAQAHLTVHKTGVIGGIGVDLQQVNTGVVADKPIWQNQFSKMDDSLFDGELVNDTRGFMLVTSNVLEPIRNPANFKTDIKTKTFSS